MRTGTTLGNVGVIPPTINQHRSRVNEFQYPIYRAMWFQFAEAMSNPWAAKGNSGLAELFPLAQAVLTNFAREVLTSFAREVWTSFAQEASCLLAQAVSTSFDRAALNPSDHPAGWSNSHR
ncbi:hypothetical protein N9Z44_04685 [Mariniblastus sp.]|nr:hypothetical protein [Mariniblastus sp.]